VVESGLDNLDRLAKAWRGTLTGSPPPTGVTSPTFKQEWKEADGTVGLESLGKWRVFRQATDGSSFTGAGDLTQTRTHNAVNEVTGVGEERVPASVRPGLAGGALIDPAYDAAGNMISGPKPGSLAAGEARLWFQWDAWNRLTKVQDDDSGSRDRTIAEYRYDGRNYRIGGQGDMAHSRGR